MIKKILVCLDGSSYAKAVSDYGIWLAKSFDAAITGVHVVDIVALEGPFIHDISGSLGFEPFLNFSSRIREALTSNGKEILDSFKEECKKSGVECSAHLLTGIVSNEISNLAKLSDVVVIGRRGVNARFEHGLLGGTTEGVIRKSPASVCIAPDKFICPKNPLLCYDGSPNAAKAMHSAAEFAKTLGLALTVVTVEKNNDSAMNEAKDYLKSYGLKVKFVSIRDEHPPLAIEKYHRETNSDLVFIGVSHHSKIVEMVLGSTTEHVIRNLPGPFFLGR